MPYCSVCKSYADYEYDMSLSDGRFLHESCLLKLEIRKDKLESVMQSQKAQLILSLFVMTDAAKADAASKAALTVYQYSRNKLRRFNMRWTAVGRFNLGIKNRVRKRI